jgi:hypothetical protein
MMSGTNVHSVLVDLDFRSLPLLTHFISFLQGSRLLESIDAEDEAKEGEETNQTSFSRA